MVARSTGCGGSAGIVGVPPSGWAGSVVRGSLVERTAAVVTAVRDDLAQVGEGDGRLLLHGAAADPEDGGGLGDALAPYAPPPGRVLTEDHRVHPRIRPPAGRDLPPLRRPDRRLLEEVLGTPEVAGDQVHIRSTQAEWREVEADPEIPASGAPVALSGLAVRAAGW